MLTNVLNARVGLILRSFYFTCLASMENEYLPSLHIVAFIAALSGLIIYFAVPYFLSPLSKVPSIHWSSGYSSLWITWTRWRGQELAAVYQAHQNLGPLVRLGPKDLSVSCYSEGVRKIYGSGFDKPMYYDFFSYYGKPNSFCSLTQHDHTYHRKRISGVYTKSALFKSDELLIMAQKMLYDRFIPSLMTQSRQNQPSELLEISYSLCIDVVTQFIFGYKSGSNFIEDSPREVREWLEHYEKRFCSEAFWSQELPTTTRVLKFLGVDFLPEGYVESTQYLEDWMMKMCDSADAVLDDEYMKPEDTPLVYQQVKLGQVKVSPDKNLQQDRLAVASELFDHMSGAREVLGLVVAYTIYYISRHPNAQDRLRDELATAGVSMKQPSTDDEKTTMPEPSVLDKLPYLSAILMESFRMRPNSTPLPRITPHDRSVSLAGYHDIPPATRVNTFQWLIHRDPTKWKEVDEWKPERWLESKDDKEGESRLWAFGSGPRMCIGVNFTYYIMRYMLVAIFTNFRTTVINPETFGQFPAGSLEDKLWVSFWYGTMAGITDSNSEGMLSLVFVGLASLWAGYEAKASFSFSSLRARRLGYRYSHLSTSQGYSDNDGDADPKELKQFSDRLPKTLALTFLVIDLIFVLIRLLPIEAAQPPLPQIIARILIGMQLGLLFGVSSPVKRFNIGCCAGTSCFVSIVASLYHVYWVYRGTPEATRSIGFLVVGELISLLLAGICAFLLPRRPGVIYHGRPVDGQLTVSAIERYSFSWTQSLLTRAKVEGRLEYEDLPALDQAGRSDELLSQISELTKRRSRSLWLTVFRAHRAKFFLQWSLTIASGFALYAPQLCMLQILTLLEQRGDAHFNSLDVWFWVVALGLAKMAQVVVESWLEWTNWALLSVPVRSQLAAMIFRKSLRTKDIKGTEVGDEKEAEQSSVDVEPGDEVPEDENLLGDSSRANESPDNEELTKSGEEEDETSSGVHQGFINLVGSDAVRISNFAAENNLFLSTLVNLSFALLILFRLLGWQGVCAGLVMPIMLTPLNLRATRLYSDAQGSVMSIRDQRMAIVGEALQGIRQIKFTSLEGRWQAMIMTIRTKELKEQWLVYVLTSGLLCIWASAPLLFSTVALAVYGWQNGGMSPAVAFTALSIFGTLEYALSVVPNLITEAIDANVSVGRIEKHLEREEKTMPQMTGEIVLFNHATVRWPSNVESSDAFSLRDLDLEFPKSELSIICGKTGSGKSLLLASILGESDVTAGSISLPGTQSVDAEEEWIDHSLVAYVAQIPWTENATIRDNILFGLPFIRERYEQVVWACALETDIEIMPDGELTEVGANGINLSGGQRWRITYARALYSRAGTLVLDDIFSAVDAHVGRHILEHGLLGSLAEGRTRILATHHEDLALPHASYIVRLSNSTHASSIARTITQKPQSTSRVRSSTAKAKQSRDSSYTSDSSFENLEIIEPPKPTRFVEEEVRERGRIKWTVYKVYMSAAGGFRFWFTALGVFVLAQAALLGRAWLVKLWTENHNNVKPTVDSRQESSNLGNGHLYFYLGWYLFISLMAAALSGIKFAFFCHGCIEASRKLFDAFTFTVLRAPLRWLDKVPQGRVLNRFSSDFTAIDTKLARDISHFWEEGLAFLAIVTAGLFVSIYMLIPSLVLSAVSVYYVAEYLPGAREIKRLEATAQSPVFEHYGSTLTGIITIRAFRKTDEYLTLMHDRLDEYARATWNLWLTQRWMSFRMSAIGAAFSFAVASVVVARPQIDAALAGFALSFSLKYSEAVVEMIRRYSAIELDMNSTERVVEYTNMPVENQSGISPPQNWPAHGDIEIKNLVAAYAPELPPVLKGITLKIKGGQRIGVIGRTGSGKSSLTLALFRFIAARSGNIIIDGVDISEITLHELRSRLAIIPQDPVLFSGTLRSNLDLFGVYDEEVLLQALRHVHLLQTPLNTHEEDQKQSQGKTTFESLDSAISEGGLSLSQGERQLVCLARAIVSRPKIMVLDEATSAVDMATDTLIQRSIRERFDGSTLIVIAHRLSTIADFDKILVLDNGEVVEFDEPKKLLQNRDGAFRKMLDHSGEREKLERLVMDT
ncbi:putative ABC bile acid transporter [Sclerotinia borealis F-4128]|uniref:Putative ABC bile acid transporter n=1 Tax=Sclerotinia borealis (strain F-4128) TaxID=1432307 RepID=W9C9J0_SCLBF|nr:putative ABC bile acid transporter [Sclerotinia borealis F-4128]